MLIIFSALPYLGGCGKIGGVRLRLDTVSGYRYVVFAIDEHLACLTLICECDAESAEEALCMRVFRAGCSWRGGGVRVLMAAYVTGDTGSISEATGARERGSVLPIF